MKTLMLLMLTLATGCAGNAFLVDSRFTPEEEKQIQSAVDSWAAVGAEPVDLIWRQKVTGLETYVNTLVRAREREAISLSADFLDADVFGTYTHGGPAARIIVSVERADETGIQTIVAHEFGHRFIGRAHLSEPGALMNAYPGSLTPTPADVRALVLAGQP